jgi:deoxyribodipyrimidine photo-lyase
MADLKTLRDGGLAKLPIDHSVQAVSARGGTAEAVAKLRRFVTQRLADYDEQRNDPQGEGTSGLSPYLHFGHIAAAQVWQSIVDREGWKMPARPRAAGGKRSGWWKMSAAAEAFLDQLVTWRELGFVFCHYRPDSMDFESLPDWALATLRRHTRDRREYRYDLHTFESAATHDPLWNAAQRQLRQEGLIHNYLRMLWGKKILEWSPTPEAALEVMIELNNKYALDGRDPNSYSGIFWCLGRFDRAWGPERPIFGTVRYMSSASTARKLRVRDYMARYGPSTEGTQRTLRLR